MPTRRAPGADPDTEPTPAGRRATKAELLELLGELLEADPAGADGRCHYCLSSPGQHHEEACLWARIASAVGAQELADTLVGDLTEPDDGDGEHPHDEDEDDAEVLFPVPRAGEPRADPYALTLDVVHAELAMGSLNPATLEPIRQAAGVLDELDEDEEELVGVPIEVDDGSDE